MKSHMSNSQYGKFMDCPATAFLYAHDRYKYEMKIDAACGVLAHCDLSNDKEKLDAFCRDNWHLIGLKTKGAGLVKKAKDMGRCIKIAREKACYSMFWDDEVEREVPVTFEMFGIEWHAILDMVHRRHKWIADWKFLESIWHPKNCRIKVGEYEDGNDKTRPVPPWIKWNWWRQSAVYRQAAIRGLGFTPENFYYIPISTETPPDHALFTFNDKGLIADELLQIEENIGNIQKMKAGEVEPWRCEGKDCQQCRKTKVVTEATDIT